VMVIRFSGVLVLSLIISISMAVPSSGQSDWDFVLVDDERDLMGCWKRVLFPAQVMQEMNKINLYDESVEMFENQYFCFQENNELYTLISNSPERSGLSEEELLKFMKIFPCVERHKLVKRGLVLIEHLEARQQTTWLTSIVVGSDDIAPAGSIRIGDLLMTIRNFETGEDLYYRQLRRVE